jgi:hypothetical protein
LRLEKGYDLVLQVVLRLERALVEKVLGRCAATPPIDHPPTMK